MTFFFNSISENSSIGYILEVDLNWMNWMTYIMTIHYLQKNLKLVKICCQNIILTMQMNME